MHIIAKIIVAITLLSSYIQSAHLVLALNEENLVPNQSQFSFIIRRLIQQQQKSAFSCP